MEEKALEEVREWKRIVYEDIKHLSSADRIKHINESADKLMKEYGLQLKVLETEKTK